MLCLQCQRWQPRRAWSRAQWRSLKCICLDLRRSCCSDCNSDYWCSTTPSSATTAPTRIPTPSESVLHCDPAWAQNLLVVLRVASIDELIQRTYYLVSLARHIGEFMIYWMQEMGRTIRKLLSHNGALRYRQGMDGFLSGKGDWTDPISRQRYFDPGNDIYSRAFQLAFPDIAERTSENWNAETHGDIFESLLALKCLDSYRAVRKCPGYPRFPANCPASRIAAWIEELVTLVWGVSLIYPVNDSPSEWVSRWHAETGGARAQAESRARLHQCGIVYKERVMCSER